MNILLYSTDIIFGMDGAIQALARRAAEVMDTWPGLPVVVLPLVEQSPSVDVPSNEAFQNTRTNRRGPASPSQETA